MPGSMEEHCRRERSTAGGKEALQEGEKHCRRERSIAGGDKDVCRKERRMFACRKEIRMSARTLMISIFA